MHPKAHDAIEARLDIHRIAIGELLRVLAPAQLEQFSRQFAASVADHSEGRSLRADADAAAAHEVAAILSRAVTKAGMTAIARC